MNFEVVSTEDKSIDMSETTPKGWAIRLANLYANADSSEPDPFVEQNIAKVEAHLEANFKNHMRIKNAALNYSMGNQPTFEI